MGMAASQARLLCITARLHDVEYEAQSIQNAKIQLSTQSDQVYNDYLEALDATTLTVTSIDTKSGEKSTIAATFNNLFSENALTTADGSIPALRDSNGKLIVSDDVYKAYMEVGENSDAYTFAMQMMGVDATGIEDAEEKVLNGNVSSEVSEAYQNLVDYAKEHFQGYDTNNEYEELVSAPENSIIGYDEATQEEQDEYENLVSVFKYKLYKSYSADIYAKMSGSDSSDFDSDKFNKYMSIYNQIKACGGCRPISDFNGPYGNASNNNEWLTAMIESAQLSIDTVTTDKKTGEVTFTGTSPSSDTSISYTTTTTIDKTAEAKAEAKYEHDLKEIDKKDKKYDLTLSKLESERTALTTEYDSVKKVIEDNIDRTFGIFS
jgi:hypothetical protein